jgi:hypothetical protein
MKNVDNPFVAVEFNDGQRFELDLTPARTADQQINFGIATYTTGDLVPLGLLVVVDTAGGPHNLSDLNPTADAVSNGDTFRVTAQQGHNKLAEVPAGQTVKSVNPVAYLSPA